MKYSACGREQYRKKKKESFKETTTYEIMKDTLLQLHPNSDSKEILAKTGRWLSGAPDRDGGKKQREQRAERNERREENN